MPHNLIQAAALVAPLLIAREQPGGTIPAYVPEPVQLSKHMPYVRSDASIYIVGANGMQPILEQFNQLFIRTHPGFRFTMLLNGASAGLGALTAGASAFAPLDREALPLELRPFRQLYGYEPLDVHIGRVGYTAAGRVNPPAVYVNVSNPLDGLNVEQVARIFVAGGGKGDITHWSQLGLAGLWAERVIHVYGPRDDGGFASAMRHEYMDGLPFTRRYEPLPLFVDIVRAVAEDRYGIALLDRFDSKELPRDVKMLPLSRGEGTPYSAGSYEDVFDGNYPFSPCLHIYANRPPGQALDPFIREYIRLVLSKEGQGIIADQKHGEEGVVPLNAVELNRELNKLQ